jgi:hypothetical protein
MHRSNELNLQSKALQKFRDALWGSGPTMRLVGVPKIGLIVMNVWSGDQ